MSTIIQKQTGLPNVHPHCVQTVDQAKAEIAKSRATFEAARPALRDAVGSLCGVGAFLSVEKEQRGREFAFWVEDQFGDLLSAVQANRLIAHARRNAEGALNPNQLLLDLGPTYLGDVPLVKTQAKAATYTPDVIGAACDRIVSSLNKLEHDGQLAHEPRVNVEFWKSKLAPVVNWYKRLVEAKWVEAHP